MVHATALNIAIASALVLTAPMADRSEVSSARSTTPASGLTTSPVCREGAGGSFQAEYTSCARCKAAGYAARPDGRFVCVPITGTNRYALGYGPTADDSPPDDSNKL